MRKEYLFIEKDEKLQDDVEKRAKRAPLNNKLKDEQGVVFRCLMEDLLDHPLKNNGTNLMSSFRTGETVINVTFNCSFFTLKGGDMRDINITNNDRVGVSITGDNNCVEQSVNSQDNTRKVYDVIVKIELDSQKYSKELIDELNDIKDDCKSRSDDENSKYRKIMSKLGDFVKKISVETARTVIPATIMAILNNEGYLM